ncbi:MAG: PAS domain S-box protein [Elusimicrobia bacterium]|nr:PAS domain S-box protein [Elusimicrobiota bacterium]
MGMTLEDLKRETAIPVILADERGSVVFVNAAFEAAFGWRRDEIDGKPLTVIIPKALRDAHHLGFSRFLTTGQPTLLGRPLRLMTVDKAGREFECEHVIVAEKVEGRWMFGATLRAEVPR